MKYKYNIVYTLNNTKKTMNFKNKESMIKFLNVNRYKMTTWSRVHINFNQVSLPLKHTVWCK